VGKAAAIVLLGMVLPSAAVAQACPPPPQETVRVAGVIDGDTLKLADGRELRLEILLDFLQKQLISFL